MDVDLAARFDEVTDLGRVIGMSMRDIQIHFLCACQRFGILIQAFCRAGCHTCVNQQRAVFDLNQVHLVAVVIDDLPNLHTALIIQQAALVLVLGHAVDRILEGYNIAVLHARLAGIRLERHLGLLGAAIPIVTGIRADCNKRIYLRTAHAGSCLILGLIKFLGRIRSLGIAAIQRIFDGCARCIREQRHILGHSKGARGVRIKRVGVVVIIGIGIRRRNLGRRTTAVRGALSFERGLCDANGFARKVTIFRNDRIGQTTQHQIVLDLHAIQCHTCSLDDYDAVAHLSNRTGLGDVIRDHIVQNLYYFSARDIILRSKQIARLAVDISLLRKGDNIRLCPGRNARIIGKPTRAVAACNRHGTRQHANRFFAGDVLFRTNLAIAAFHYPGLRCAQYCIRIIGLSQIRKSVIRFALIIHQPINDHGHITADNRLIRSKSLVGALEHTVIAPLINYVFCPMPFRILICRCSCKGEQCQQHHTG